MMINLMKLVVLFTVLAMTIVASAQRDDPYRVELLNPRGFRVLRPGEPDLYKVTFLDGFINSPIRGPVNGISFSSFSRRGDGWWVYENNNATLNPGDTLFYSISEISGMCGLVYSEEFHVPIDAPQVSASLLLYALF